MYSVQELEPSVRRVAEQVLDIQVRHLGPRLIGLILHGSAVKGGFINGASDIDFLLYVHDEALTAHGELPLGLAIDIHRDLAKIDVRPFRYIQFRVASPSHNELGYLVPETYRLLFGRILNHEYTRKQLFAACQNGLEQLDPNTVVPSQQLLHHGEQRLQRIVRSLCTEVYPVVFQVLTLQHKDSYEIWNLSKFEAIELMDTTSELGVQIRRFFSAVQIFYPDETNVDAALDIIRYGTDFLRTAKQWWTETGHGEAATH